MIMLKQFAILSYLSLVMLVSSANLFGEEKTASALAEYVAKPDASYNWKTNHEGMLGAGRYAELKLISQTWRGIEWKHQLFILKPSRTEPDTKHALLLITGGSWTHELDQPGHRQNFPRGASMLSAIAEQLRTPIVVLRHVPHQPLFDGKYEDAIIAYTLDQYFESGDTQWPLLLPMVKAAVRAMDAAHAYCQQGWGLEIERFTVTGASKRGWTTWLTAAIDDRAVAIAPIVIDVLNMAPQLRHQKATWGELSPEINDYTRRGLHRKLNTPRGKLLRDIIDPYNYRRDLEQPKLIVLGTNDAYWPLDALNLYWAELPGVKHVLYVPNKGHGVEDLLRLTGTLAEFHRRAVQSRPLPNLMWTFKPTEAHLSLTVKCAEAPREVRVWITTSPTRDFREASWSFVDVREKSGEFAYDLTWPNTGFAAIFGEAEYDGKLSPFYLSTNVKILNTSGLDRATAER